MPGLRERNRARTRAEIRARALELIAKQGYAATTVGQIAEAADVSQSTFFRYFATKEDALLADDFDPQIVERFRAQPPDVTPFEAFGNALREVFNALSDQERETERERIRTILTVPELRDRMLGSLSENIRLISVILAERVGRSAEDAEIEHFAGALVGVTIAAMFRATRDPRLDPLHLLDDAVAHLAAGLPL